MIEAVTKVTSEEIRAALHRIEAGQSTIDDANLLRALLCSAENILDFSSSLLSLEEDLGKIRCRLHEVAMEAERWGRGT